MALDFPASPADGATYAAPNGTTYTFHAAPAPGYWSAGSGGGGGASISVGVTPPPSPVANQLWWKSDDGVMYIYYNDGNTTQWVPTSPQAATPPASAWTLINRQVLAAGATSIIMDGLSGYRVVKILGGILPSASGVAALLRVRKAGVTFSDANYNYVAYGANSASAGTAFSGVTLNATGWPALGAMLIDASPRGVMQFEASFNDITRAGVWVRGVLSSHLDASGAGLDTRTTGIAYNTIANLPLDGFELVANGGTFLTGSSVFVTGMK